MHIEFPPPVRAARACLAASACVALALLAGCGTPESRKGVYQQERFESTETHVRSLEAPTWQACEAARRALLGGVAHDRCRRVPLARCQRALRRLCAG